MMPLSAVDLHVVKSKEFVVPNLEAVNSCRLCAIASGHSEHGYDVPVLSGLDYFAVASIGGFIPGWSLLCTHRHSFNLVSDFRNDGFYFQLDQLVAAVASTFGKPVIFEHGSCTEGSQTSCGTSHAHLHVVPFSDCIESLATADKSLRWQSIEMRDLEDAVEGGEYLFVASNYDGINTRGNWARLEVPRSQYFRKLLANQMGKPLVAEYRTHPFEEQSCATAIRLREAIAIRRFAA